MWNLDTLHKPQPLVFNEYNPTHRFFLELYKEVGGYVWDVLVQESLEEVLDGSLDQVSQPAPNGVSNGVYKELKDPVERTQTIDINADVANVSDLEIFNYE